MQVRVFQYRKQPWKTLYIVFEFSYLLLAKIPWWILTNILPSARPSPRWSLKRAMFVRVIETLFKISYNVGGLVRLSDHTAISKGEGFEGVWIPAVPNLVLGEIKEAADTNGVKSSQIPGYWINKKGLEGVKAGAPPVPGEKVVYCLHGGAYIFLSAHPRDPTAPIAKGILKNCPTVTRSFSVEYRLSKALPFVPHGAFPSALIDALAGYNYLVNIVGFDPKDIIIEGDSAGGNLALALVRYLIEYGSHDPSNPLPAVPGALLLCSPWADMGSSHSHAAHTDRNSSIDYLGYSPERGQYITKAFTGNLGTSLVDSYRYFSPGSAHEGLQDTSFKGYPKTFITSGGLEMLFDQIESLQKKMKAQLGDDWVTYYSAPDAVHDWITIEPHEPERTESLQAIAKWLTTI